MVSLFLGMTFLLTWWWFCARRFLLPVGHPVVGGSRGSKKSLDPTGF